MSALDFSPLFRTAIGFDRMARLVDAARAADAPSYPPYNIERTGDDAYVLTMAVAGFGPDDIEITSQDNVLTVSGKAPQAEEGRRYLHRGIAGRAFERRFVLADHIQVQGADLQNGLLHVALKRLVPEALKPRRIAIGSAPMAQKTLEVEAANEQDAGQAQAA
ncbi:Hsp20 family protein [Roseomonas sp. OT10]|uniref:Hsp20 family protein n=1 Tax=Roseomonas cutis TaxID=2897332 RepID=UPI001E519B8C|nr:Hsp20 family protein [Roseomonas sp. OT10]UFN46877.1 Hsp20 family protein [Roseomonas sp. OT10]